MLAAAPQELFETTMKKHILANLFNPLDWVISLKGSCGCCKSKWTINERCVYCGNNVCCGCGENIRFGRYCRRLKEKMDMVFSLYTVVMLYSSNYKGRVPDPKFLKGIITKYYRDREDAEQEIKFLAACAGAEYITGFKYLAMENRQSNYVYKTWACSGII
jgi:hypothetical protein